jgi:outer membrane receptor protein involved in Fe transport
VIATCALVPSVAVAQTGGVVGRVIDAETGEPIPAATLVLRNTPLQVIAGSDGRYVFARLEPTRYVVFAIAVGYGADSVEVTVGAGTERTADVALRPIPLVLPEMVVTAGRGAERMDEAIASVAVIAGREVVDRNVTTLDKALPFVPGVTFNGNEQIDIRGAAGMSRGVGSRVLMLLDGHPILTGDGGEVDFRSIPLLDLDRSEVVKGAYSAVYGSGALGGVVNVVTKPISDEPETVARIHANAFDYRSEHEWADGTQTDFGFGLQHSRRVGDVGVRGFVGYENADGYTENGSSRRLLGRVKLASRIGQAHPWDAYVVFTQEKAGEQFVWRSEDEPYRVPDDAAGNHTSGFKVLSGGTWTPRARSTHLVKVSPYFNVNTLENHFNDNDDWHDAFKPGLLVESVWFAGNRHALRFGVDGAHTWVRSNFVGDPRITDLAAFAQDDVEISSRLKGNLGVRVDYHRATLGDAELAVSPKLGVAYRVASGSTVRASLGAGYRAPSAIEQFVSSQQFGFRVVPNPELRGENAWSGELGSSVRLLDMIRVDAAVFGSLFKELISPAPAPDQPFVFQFQNVSRARVMGVDVGVHAQVVPRALEVQASYLLLDTEDRDTGAELPYRSRHNVTGTVNVLNGLAGVDVRYRSRVEAVLAYPLDPRSHATVVDLRMGYRVWNVLWQVKVTNLFNQFYVDVQERNPGAPRSLAITAVRGL